MSTVRLHNVSKRLSGIDILNKVSLEIAEGERLVILGPSGCGKTTILRLIAGLMAPDSGRIDLAGATVSANGRVILPPEQRQLGMVFQDLALWPHLSVAGNIEFGLKAKGLPKKVRKRHLQEALSLVGMSDYEQRKPAQLSGGEQQRVAIARALVMKPKLLLMDEPLSSLDIELNRRLRKEILHLQKQLGFTLVYVTHAREEAFELASRIVTMQQGRIVFQGTADEAKKQLQS